MTRSLTTLLSLTLLLAAAATAQTAVTWGNLQWPPEMADPACAAEAQGVYGQVYMQGLTDNPGQGVGIEAQLGFGPVGSTPDATWEWFDAVYNVDAGNNDEYVVWMNFTLPLGDYHYTYRFRYAGDPDWYYAAERGLAAFTTHCGAVGNRTLSWTELKREF